MWYGQLLKYIKKGEMSLLSLLVHFLYELTQLTHTRIPILLHNLFKRTIDLQKRCSFDLEKRHKNSKLETCIVAWLRKTWRRLELVGSMADFNPVSFPCRFLCYSLVASSSSRSLHQRASRKTYYHPIFIFSYLTFFYFYQKAAFFYYLNVFTQVHLIITSHLMISRERELWNV